MLKRKRPTSTVTSNNASDTVSIECNESSSQSETESDPQCKKRRMDDNLSDLDANNQTSANDVNIDLKVAQNGQNSNANSNAKRNQRKNKKNKGNNNKVAQASNQPVDYDYSKVDFSKFQGGSQKPKPNTEFKSKFNGKVCVYILYYRTTHSSN